MENKQDAWLYQENIIGYGNKLKPLSMTPKEKATELVNKCKEYAYDIGINGELYDAATEKMNAKELALICCDEVLNYMGSDRGTEFWNDVRIEINKL